MHLTAGLKSRPFKTGLSPRTVKALCNEVLGTVQLLVGSDVGAKAGAWLEERFWMLWLGVVRRDPSPSHRSRVRMTASGGLGMTLVAEFAEDYLFTDD